MPQFTCPSCNAGFQSAACLADLNDKACSECGARVETADARTPRQVLDDRVGHLIARREVARAQARLDAERWVDDGGRVRAVV
jgi:transcription initiation factor IIE alpha subunit